MYLSRRPLQGPPEAEGDPPGHLVPALVDGVEVLRGLHVGEAAGEEDHERDGGRDAAEEGGAGAEANLEWDVYYSNGLPNGCSF